MANTLSFKNYGPQLDVNGDKLYSHGGHILKTDGWYYLYGEDRRENKKVSIYRSKDLTDWEYRGTALDTDTPYVAYVRTRNNPQLKNPNPTRPDGAVRGVTIERPKVLYNAKTERYVMWMHWENGNDYHDAHAAIASSDNPEGPFQYHGSFRPVGHMSRDCTLFQDDDGTAYFVSAARDNADLNIYRLTEDYMAVDEFVKSIYPQCFREAPAIVKRGGIYFLLSSECTGWEPNQGCYGWAKSIDGKWSELRNFGSHTTYDTQPTFMYTIQGKETSCVLYIGDRWDPVSYFDGRYIVLPVRFPTDTSLEVDWCDEVDIDMDTGRFTSRVKDTGMVRLLSKGKIQYLLPADPDHPVNGKITTKRLCYSDEQMLWQIIDTESGCVRIKHVRSGLFIQADGDSITLAVDDGKPEQLWKMAPQSDGAIKLIACDGRVLRLARADEDGVPRLEADNPNYSPSWGREPQAFLLAKAYPSIV